MAGPDGLAVLDPDFNPDLLDDTLVLLDGQVQRHVLVADDDAGVVERFRCDGRGRVRNDSGYWAVETVAGKVEIVLPCWIEALLERERFRAHQAAIAG
jgi:hypothetical protein